MNFFLSGAYIGVLINCLVFVQIDKPIPASTPDDVEWIYIYDGDNNDSCYQASDNKWYCYNEQV